MAREQSTARDDFARNLRWLCQRERSVSDVCRRVGVNRQQFARYLNGAARPSPHNLARICRFFGVEPEDMTAPHARFVRDEPMSARRERRGAEAVTAVFPGDRRALRRYVGFYFGHYRTPSLPGRIVRTLIEVREQNGLFLTDTLERTRHPDTGDFRRCRYVGMLSMHHGTLFLVERGRREGHDVSESILTPDRRSWFCGVLSAYSWRLGRPFVSRCVWKKAPSLTKLRDLVERCGAFSTDCREIDPYVVERFNDDRDDGVVGGLK